MISPPEAFELSTEAGWNQTAADWERLIELAPDGCFSIREGDRLAATAVALELEPRLGWIGMVLTRQECRGKGYARELMQRCLDRFDARNVACVKLDATDLGRPVYAKLGFEDERPVSRWSRAPGPAHAVAAPTSNWHDSIPSLDREAFGADRLALLRALAREDVYSIPGAGFAFSRPGRLARHFGPCAACDPETAAALLAAFLAAHSGEPAILDLFDEHEYAARIAMDAGFQPVRRLIRMARGPADLAHLASGPGVYALAGFEYG